MSKYGFEGRQLDEAMIIIIYILTILFGIARAIIIRLNTCEINLYILSIYENDD